MITKRSLSEKGQLVIPKDMREYLKWRNKENVTIEINNDSVMIKKEKNEEFLDDFLNLPKIKRNPNEKLKDIILEQYEKEIS